MNQFDKVPNRKYLALQAVIVFTIIYFISKPFLASFFKSDLQAIKMQAASISFLIGLLLATFSLALEYFKIFEKIKEYALLRMLILALGGGGGGLIGLGLLLAILSFLNYP